MSMMMKRAFWVLALLAACGGGDGGGGTSGSGGARGTGGAGSGGASVGTGGSGADAGAGGSGGGDAGGGGLTAYKTCTADKRVGEFVVKIANDLEPPFSDIGGQINDAVNPYTILEEKAKVGECVVYQPPTASVCNPQCDLATQICSAGKCVKQPVPKDVGKITLTGLVQPVELENISNRYVNPSSTPLMHPVFKEGANITLAIAGAGGYGPLQLKGEGVAAVEMSKDAIPAESGKPVMLSWKAPGKTSSVTRMHIKFSVNIHGAVDTWFECDVPDTGSYTVGAALMTELFKHGISGFPAVELTRQSSDTGMVPSGCMDFRVEAPISRPLAVPGLISCHDQTECPTGKTCGDDLACH
jgi:hypothetical protein